MTLKPSLLSNYTICNFSKEMAYLRKSKEMKLCTFTTRSVQINNHLSLLSSRFYGMDGYSSIWWWDQRNPPPHNTQFVEEEVTNHGRTDLDGTIQSRISRHLIALSVLKNLYVRFLSTYFFCWPKRIFLNSLRVSIIDNRSLSTFV